MIPPWRSDAACKTVDIAVFFPPGRSDDKEDAAKAVCAGCPVVDDCLHYALDTHQDDGVWGGLTEDERRRLQRRRRDAERRLRRTA